MIAQSAKHNYLDLLQRRTKLFCEAETNKVIQTQKQSPPGYLMVRLFHLTNIIIILISGTRFCTEIFKMSSAFSSVNLNDEAFMLYSIIFIKLNLQDLTTFHYIKCA